MYSLTLRWQGVADGVLRRQIAREAAAWPTPPLPGLRSRYWRPGRSGHLYGRYIFSDADSANDFTEDSDKDPATRALKAMPESMITMAEQGSLTVSAEQFDRPLFIIAAPRSGSTLLFDLLALSTQVWTIGSESHGPIEGVVGLHPAERNFESHTLSDRDATAETVEALHAGLLLELMDAGHQRWVLRPASQRLPSVRMIEKTPENVLRIPFLAAAFPDARFVFLHREPRQSISSLIEAWRHGGFVNIPSLPGWARGAWCFLLPEDWRRLNRSRFADVAAFQWATANQRALDDLELLLPQRWIAIDYEELITAPRPTIERICSFAELDLGPRLEAVLACPLKASATTVTPVSPIKWKSNPDFDASVLQRYTLIAGRLRELGHASARPPTQPVWNGKLRFSCRVEDLLPAQSEENWHVSRSFHLQVGSRVPLAILREARFRERLADDVPVLWVKDPRTDALLPYCVARRHAAALINLVPGMRAPRLDPKLTGQLATAGVLVTAGSEDLVSRREEAALAQAKIQFQSGGWCLQKGLIPAAQTAALDDYFEVLIAGGDWPIGDSQVARRHGWHNQPLARFFHHQLTSWVAGVVGEAVRPSYCYVSAYREGAVLQPHVDRKQCIFTISLWIARSGEHASQAWPLCFRTAVGRVAVTQSAGDGVLFLGNDLPHWRDRPPPAGAGTTLIFHYVPSGFVESLD